MSERVRAGTAAPVQQQPDATVLPPSREGSPPIGNVNQRMMQNRARMFLEDRIADTQRPEALADPDGVGRDVNAAAAEALRTASGLGAIPRVGAGVLVNEADLPQHQSPLAGWDDRPDLAQTPTPVRPGEPAVAQASDLLAENQFIPNPLSKFHQPTYHFRLIAVGDKDLTSKLQNVTGIMPLMRLLDGEVPMITIAQSGVTAGFVIKDVEMDALVAPNYSTHNVNATNVTMTIVEPLGVSFLDAMRDAAISLQTTDAGRCFYLLELTFKAYADDGTPLAGNTEQMGPTQQGATSWNPLAGENYSNGGRFIWLLQFTDIETKLDAGGATYVIKAIPFEQQIFDESRFMRMPESAEIPADTVGRFLEVFARHLTQSWRNRLGAVGSEDEVVKFDFVTHIVNHPSFPQGTDPRTWRLVPQSPEENPERHLSMSYEGETGLPTARIAMGTSIAEVIDFMFANCEQAHKIALDRGNASGRVDANDREVNQNRFRQSIVMRVEPEVSVSAERGYYDTISSTYMLDVVLHIWPYYTQAPILSDTQRDNARDPVVQRRMLEALINRGRFAKRYDYLFTGKNTEVIDLDVNFSLKWSAILPMIGGARHGMEAVEVHARAHEGSRNPQGNIEEADLRVLTQQARQLRGRLAQVNEEIEQLRGATSENDGLSANERGEVAAARTGANLRATDRRIAELEQASFRSPETEAELARLRGNRGRLSGLVQEQQSLRLSIGDTRRIVNQETQRQVAEASQTTATVQAATRVFAEDRILGRTPNARNVFPLSFRQGREDVRSQSGTGFTGTRHIDKALFGAVLEQLYEEFSGFFVNIEMSIRGDPFWLGTGNLERQTNLRLGRNSAARVGESATPSQPSADPNGPGRARPLADFQNGDVCLLLTFRYPLGINENTSTPEFRQHEMVNGIYRAVRVRSNFSEGEFKQTLTAMKYPLIDLGMLLMAERDPSAGQPRQPVRQSLADSLDGVEWPDYGDPQSPPVLGEVEAPSNIPGPAQETAPVVVSAFPAADPTPPRFSVVEQMNEQGQPVDVIYNLNGRSVLASSLSEEDLNEAIRLQSAYTQAQQDPNATREQQSRANEDRIRFIESILNRQ